MRNAPSKEAQIMYKGSQSRTAEPVLEDGGENHLPKCSSYKYLFIFRKCFLCTHRFPQLVNVFHSALAGGDDDRRSCLFI